MHVLCEEESGNRSFGEWGKARRGVVGADGCILKRGGEGRPQCIWKSRHLGWGGALEFGVSVSKVVSDVVWECRREGRKR